MKMVQSDFGTWKSIVQYYSNAMRAKGIRIQSLASIAQYGKTQNSFSAEATMEKSQFGKSLRKKQLVEETMQALQSIHNSDI